MLEADGAAIVINESSVQIVSESVGSTEQTFQIALNHSDDERVLALSVARTDADFDTTAKTALNRMLLQLSRSMKRHLGNSRSEEIYDGFRQTLERLPIGAMVVTADLNVLLYTASAKTVLVRNDGLSFRVAPGATRKEQLTIHDARAEQELQTNIRLMLQQDDTYEQMISVPRRANRPYGLLIARLGASRPNVLFLVLISDPDAKLPLQPDALRRLYRLTPAESRLCAALANGNTLKTYAEAEGVALETVRSQLKQAMVKTDTHKQAQLVRLLVTGPAAFTA
ncbi:MAG: helix-turn-helix transcriptional regulator [Myxococcota bacterium]